MQRQNINRAEQLWKNWEEKQKGLENLVGSNIESSRIIQKLKYDFLRQGIYRLSVKPLEKEELCLHVIRSVISKLEKQLYPNFIIRNLNKLKELFYDKPEHLKKFEQQKAESMERLTSQFATFGFASFAEKLENYLDYERMKINIPMTTQLSDKSRMDIDLKLDRDHAGNYRFIEYNASLYEHAEFQRSFTLPAESEITAVEAANLLQGRAVNKGYHTANSYMSNKWLQLDLTQDEPKLLEYHQDYGYDLKKELLKVTSELGLEKLGGDDILKNMEKGNLISLELSHMGQYYLCANPAGRSVILLDADKKIIKLSSLVDDVKEAKSKVIIPEVMIHKEQEKNQIHNHSFVIR